MSTTTAGVLDTSVFIATESGRQLDEALFPDEVATTVVTLAELHVGVLAATASDIRAQRLATLETVADIEMLPADEEAARMWARLRIYLAETVGEFGSTICGSRPSRHREHCPSSPRTTTSPLLTVRPT